MVHSGQNLYSKHVDGIHLNEDWKAHFQHKNVDHEVKNTKNRVSATMLHVKKAHLKNTRTKQKM